MKYAGGKEGGGGVTVTTPTPPSLPIVSEMELKYVSRSAKTGHFPYYYKK